MTTVVKEFDGARQIEIEVRDGIFWLETGEHCFKFDQNIFRHALEIAMGVLVLQVPVP